MRGSYITVERCRQQAHELLPAVHRVASLLKRWLDGTHQGGVQPAPLRPTSTFF